MYVKIARWGSTVTGLGSLLKSFMSVVTGQVSRVVSCMIMIYSFSVYGHVMMSSAVW